MDTLTRRRQARALIHIYLLGDSPRKTCLGRDIETKLCELLPNDLGYTVLNAACWQCAKVRWAGNCPIIELFLNWVFILFCCLH